MLLHHLLNKCTKVNLLRKYNYVGMLFVSFFGSSLQYLSFKCFSQLYSVIPFGFYNCLNLIVCYSILLSLILFSASIISIFKAIYSKVSTTYVLESLFG